MILRITYQIRFPLGGEFSVDPKFLFFKKIYFSMKNLLCNNQGEKCCHCIKASKCIYYMLSGENFKYYPSITVKRKMVEKRRFNKNEVIDLSFYLIGIASQYVGFIQNYFDITNTLEKQYFQKFLVEQIYLDEKKYYDGNVKFVTPISSLEEIDEMIDYFNDIYSTDIEKPIIESFISNNNKIIDYNKYVINGHLLKYEGYKYEIKVNRFLKAFFEIGLGKNACIGGGQVDEN